MNEIQTPMISSHKEKRVIVDGNEIILKVANVPVIKSLNKLVELGNKLQAKISEERIRLLSCTDADEERLSEIEKEVNSVNMDSLTKDDVRHIQKLNGEYDIVNEMMKVKQATATAEVFANISKDLMCGVLRIVCPQTNITDSLLEAITFSDTLEIVEMFIQVNKLDILPKKLLPQKIRDQLLRLASGEV